MKNPFIDMNLSSRRNQFLFLLVLTLLLHSPLFFVKTVVNPDASLIYNHLESLRFPFEYFEALLSFDAFDFQPIRDLTFFIDISIYNLTGRIIGVFLNCIIWSCCCYLILRIIEEELSEIIRWSHFVYVLCFSVYPIFYQTVNWGVARKHLLAFFFILLAIRNLYMWLRNERGPLSIILPFTLSILSLPISIAWPVWVFYKLKPSQVIKEKRFRNLVISLCAIAFIVGVINWAYYKSSIRFLQIYPQKATGIDFELILTNLGFQSMQIIAPYSLSFFYNYNPFLYAGLAALVGFLIFLAIFSYKKGNIWTWPLLAFIPQIVIQSSPHIYYDPYVIVPIFSLLIFFLKETSRLMEKLAVIMIPLFFLWAGLTWRGNEIWGDKVKFFEAGFSNSQNCTNAVMYAVRTYQSGKKLSNELYEYIQVNSCFGPQPTDGPSMSIMKLNIEPLILFFEEEIDREYREVQLRKIGKKNLYALYMLAAIFAKEGRDDELEKLMATLNDYFPNENTKIPYDFVYSEIVPDYCETKKLPECIKFSRYWGKKPNSIPYY